MNYYLLLRTLLFQLEPETAHDWTQMLMRLPGAGLLARIAAFGIPNAPRRVMGMSCRRLDDQPGCAKAKGGHREMRLARSDEYSGNSRWKSKFSY